MRLMELQSFHPVADGSPILVVEGPRLLFGMQLEVVGKSNGIHHFKLPHHLRFLFGMQLELLGDQALGFGVIAFEPFVAGKVVSYGMMRDLRYCCEATE
jgi:hypothetical protein